jgi:hypothetical protein
MLAGDVARPDIAFDVAVGLGEVFDRERVLIQAGALELHMCPYNGNTQCDKRQKKCREDD